MSLDKLFILGGKQLKTLIPEWYTAFCTLDRCTEGRYRSEQCLVLIEYTTELDLNIFKVKQCILYDLITERWLKLIYIKKYIFYKISLFDKIITPPYGRVMIHLQPLLPVPVAAVSVFYTPDDGCLTPETRRESLQ